MHWAFIPFFCPNLLLSNSMNNVTEMVSIYWNLLFIIFWIYNCNRLYFHASLLHCFNLHMTERLKDWCHHILLTSWFLFFIILFVSLFVCSYFSLIIFFNSEKCNRSQVSVTSKQDIRLFGQVITVYGSTSKICFLSVFCSAHLINIFSKQCLKSV